MSADVVNIADARAARERRDLVHFFMFCGLLVLYVWVRDKGGE